MILDKIKTYLNGRTDIKFEISPPVRDTCNLDSIVDRYGIKIITPVKPSIPLHHLNDLNEFAERFYIDLTKHTGLEHFSFEQASPDVEKSIIPRIIYRNGQKDTEILIKVKGSDIKVEQEGTYSRQVELEFF